MSGKINAAVAEKLFRSANLLELGTRADEMRHKLHPEKTVTYIVDRNINYSNICTAACRFCAFYKKPSSDEGYVLSYGEIDAKIKETKNLGGTQILLQGGLHPTWRIKDYENLLKHIRKNFDIHIHAFSPPEVVHISDASCISIEETISRLISAGLDSIPGGGAEILIDRVRARISPKKCSAGKWLEVMRTAHKLGLKTSATMMFGHIETISERIEHMEKIGRLQEETGGFTAFIPWPFQPGNTALGKNGIEKNSGSVDYLKTLAISRLMLDNIPRVQASWVTMGAKVAQLALYFGANDFGSTMLEENVVKAAGVSHKMTEKDICRLIKDAGFAPRRRLL